MIEASKELFEGFAEYCNLQSLYRKRRGQQPSASASASSSALSTGTVTADPADTDSKVVEFVALKASYEKGADNYANLLRRVIVTLQEKGQKIQSAEKLHDYAMVLDRCRRQNAIDAVAITSIVHHVGDMIRGREAAEEKNFRRSEDAYLASCPDVVPEKDEYLPKAPKQPKASMKKEKGPVAPRGVSKRKAAVLDSDDDDTDSGDDINGGAGAGSSRKKKVSTGRQGARKKSRIVASDDDSDDDGESAEETERSAEATVSLQVLEPLLEEALDYLRGIDYEKSFEMEVRRG